MNLQRLGIVQGHYSYEITRYIFRFFFLYIWERAHLLVDDAVHLTEPKLKRTKITGRE